MAIRLSQLESRGELRIRIPRRDFVPARAVGLGVTLAGLLHNREGIHA